MKLKNNLLIYILAGAFSIALIVALVVFVQKNEISHANAMKRKAKREYVSGEYIQAYTTYRELVDSMGIVSDPAELNYAHAASFTVSMVGRRNATDSLSPQTLADSTLGIIAEQAAGRYTSLTASDDNILASVAHNQLGHNAMKRHAFTVAISSGENALGSEETNKSIDSLYLYALDNFKEALRRDPSNDSIRYNYEILKRMIDYPEEVLSTTKALVSQRRYREAEKLLMKGMRRDFRLHAQDEFLKRLRTVIQIDSLHKTG